MFLSGIVHLVSVVVILVLARCRAKAQRGGVSALISSGDAPERRSKRAYSLAFHGVLSI